MNAFVELILQFPFGFHLILIAHFSLSQIEQLKCGECCSLATIKGQLFLRKGH